MSTRTLRGIAVIPNRIVGPPGIGMEEKVKPTPQTMIRDETAWTPKRRLAGNPIQSSTKDTAKMRSMERTIQTLPESIPFGNKGLDGSIIASTLAAARRLITTLAMMANPPVCGVGMECNVRSLG
jgi:hypothetical protein